MQKTAPGLEMEFTSTPSLMAGLDGSNYATAIANLSEVYLKLDRFGKTLTAYYSEDGSTWKFLGNHPINFQIKGIGLTASQDFYNSITADPLRF